MAADARVFSIAAAAPFLPTFVRALLNGEILPGRRFRDDPLALADVTIYLPTRRAARALAGALLDEVGGSAALLPRIRPLGDVDDDPAEGLLDPADLDLPHAIAPAERLVGLARLVLDWRRFVTPDRTLTPSGQPIAVPSSTADALHLARDLLALMDQAAAEGVDWRGLTTLVPDDYAAWWQTTLTFLEIATGAWPLHLGERGLADPVDRRTRVTEAIAERYRRTGSRGPVIAAGSTGSVPATATLLAAIAGLPEGAVVLPGLDFDLDAEAFAVLAPSGTAAEPSHPQAAMARLIARMGLAREDVRPLGVVEPALARRGWIVSQALRPASSTHRWPDAAAAMDAAPEESDAALAGVSLVVAANEAEEALAVAVALREALETPGATAALVTPDRALARRVCAELARFGVKAEDSAGTPLQRTGPGVLALLAAQCATEGFAPDRVAALISHPLARFGLPAGDVRSAARALEVAVLRGPRLADGSAEIHRAALRAAAGPGDDGLRPHRATAALGSVRLESAVRLAAALGAAMAPLEALAKSGGAGLDAWLAALDGALSAITADGGEEQPAPIFDGPAGRALAERLQSFRAAGADVLPVRPGEFLPVLQGLFADVKVRTPQPTARVSIWGPLEARMMSVDRLVVGGLNEGVWPPATDTGPWLSRPMRAALAFDPPELRIGLSAHDFAQALGTADVVLTRSARREGAPTVPTRFLQRLTGLLGKRRTAAMTARGARFTDWARRLDDRPPEPRAARPAPTPPLAARPKRLSVTEIETWIRDPYAIYARRILELEPLPDLGERPDFGTRGVVLHAALARFARTWTGSYDASAAARLIAIGEEEFRQLDAYPELKALWWPRFVAAAGYVVSEFEALRPDVRRIAEVAGHWQVLPGEDGFRLTGRADRIDVLPDGSVSIVDFKTGAARTPRQIATLNAPQLPLEASIARRGGFADVPAAEPAELVYVVLRGIRGRDSVVRYEGHARDPVLTLAETVAATEGALLALVEAYRHVEKPYLSRAHPFRAGERGDYDHLARVAEWSLGEEEGGEE